MRQTHFFEIGGFHESSIAAERNLPFSMLALEKRASPGSILHPTRHCKIALNADGLHGQGRIGAFKNMAQRLLDIACLHEVGCVMLGVRLRSMGGSENTSERTRQQSKAQHSKNALVWNHFFWNAGCFVDEREGIHLGKVF